MEAQDDVPISDETARDLKVGGVKLAKLSPADRARLLSPVRDAWRARFRQDLIDGGVKGKEFINELDAFDQAVFGEQEFFRFLSSIDGRAKIFDLSLRKANPTDEGYSAALDALVIGIASDFKLAAKLCGVRLTEKDEGAELLERRRQRRKIDLIDAGFKGDELIAKLEAFDDENGIDAPRPSEAAS
jgi:hypothetical protein